MTKKTIKQDRKELLNKVEKIQLDYNRELKNLIKAKLDKDIPLRKTPDLEYTCLTEGLKQEMKKIYEKYGPIFDKQDKRFFKLLRNE